MHGVQVMNECLHSLERGAIGIGLCGAFCIAEDALRNRLFDAQIDELLLDGTFEGCVHDQACALARFTLYATDDGLRSFLGVLNVGEQAERFEEVFLIETLEGLLHAECQTIVEVADGLATMLIVLVGLDGDTSECRIAGDVVRLAQHAMTGGETALEQATQIDLAARSSERVEIHVVDVDVAFAVSACELRIDDAHLVELLCGF